MAYKQEGRRPREVGAELGVAHVVEGSVRRDGTRVRIAARLVEAVTERQLWADTWDRELTDVFRIQAEIAQQIAHALHIRLSPAETERMAGDEAVNPEAYDRFLRGRELVLVPTEESRLQGIALLREAVRIDPDFAAAHAMLSRGFTPLHRGPTAEELDSAMAYAQRAIALAPDQVHGYVARASALRRSGRHEEAARIYQRAYELSPGDASVMGGLQVSDRRERDTPDDHAPMPYGLAVIHSLRGDAERALALLDHALALGLSLWSLEEMPLGGGITEDPRYVRRIEELQAERARQRERALQEGLLE